MSLSSTKTTFLKNMYKACSEICPKYNLKAIDAIVAQAMNESAWGTSSLAYKYHNYWGMKCGSSYKGASVNMKTKEEYTVGTITNISANFRAYDSLEAGVKGYCEFITSSSRYANLLGVTDNNKYITNIKNDGWATDSKYITTLTSIMNTYVIPICKNNTTKNTAIYYKKCDSKYASLVDALKSVGETDTSFTNRSKIASVNGVSSYNGTKSQNTTLLTKLKGGLLKKS